MNKSQGLTTPFARKINSEKGWNLSEQCLNTLVKEVSPYVDSDDDSIKIGRKITNYFEYSSDVKALLDGDSATVNKYQVYTTKVVSSRFQNRPRNYDVEDLVSECWLHIIEKRVLQKYKYASRLTGFLYTIILRKIYKIIFGLKKEDQYVTVSLSDPIQTAGGSEGLSLGEYIPTNEAGPERSYEYKEKIRMIDYLIEKEMEHYKRKTNASPEETARLLIRIFVLKETDFELAKKIGDTVKNLHTRRFRFKKKLKRLLDE